MLDKTTPTLEERLASLEEKMAVLLEEKERRDAEWLDDNGHVNLGPD